MSDSVKPLDPEPIIHFTDVCKTFRYRGGASRLGDDDDDDEEGDLAVEEPEEAKVPDESALKPGETRGALQNISLSIFPGERVGIIGANGSGKSTLLSIVSGMSHPTSGTVVGRGSLVPLSEITKPFNENWNGLRNLKVLAQFLGFRPELIDERAGRIARFADMEDAILQPVQTYSKQMFARIAFAAALELNGDIYIADDSIGVGDQIYQAKCFNRLVEICRAGKTLLFATHKLRLVEQLCTRAIWLEKGHVRADGQPTVVTAGYSRTAGDEGDAPAADQDANPLAAWFRQKYGAYAYPIPTVIRNTFLLPGENESVLDRSLGGAEIGGILSLELASRTDLQGIVQGDAPLVIQIRLNVCSRDTTVDLMLEVVRGKLLVYRSMIPEPIKVSAPQVLLFEVKMDTRQLPDQLYRFRISALFKPAGVAARFLSQGEIFIATNDCGPELDPRVRSFSSGSEPLSAPIKTLELDWLVSRGEEIDHGGLGPENMLQLDQVPSTVDS